jgi:toxin ParE1/3/4
LPASKSATKRERKRPDVAFRVVFSRTAQADLDELYTWLESRAGKQIAAAYTGRIKNSCLALASFPERGTKRDDIRPGVRTVGFERRATIAFAISGETVSILGIAYGGRKLKV